MQLFPIKPSTADQKYKVETSNFGNNFPNYWKPPKEMIEVVNALKKSFISKDLKEIEIEKIAGAM